MQARSLQIFFPRGAFTLAPHDWNEPFERLVEASKGQSYALWTPMIGEAIYFDGRAQAFQSWWKTSG